MKLKFVLLTTAFGVGCAATVPSELTQARIAYQNASKGQANQTAPAELHKAELALNEAEKSFNEEEDSQKTRDLAYIAQRRAEWAEAVAGVKLAEKDQKQAKSQYEKQLTTTAKQSKRELAQTKEKLAQSEKQIAENKEAMKALKKLAGVREEERGLVVTLSGNVFFATSKATLLPGVTSRLNQIAATLMTMKEHNIIVEGHTDSTGSPEKNQELSQARADAVKEHLVNQGYPEDKIEARGVGSSHPVGSNKTGTGRASNRRVEIIVQPLQPSAI